MIVHPNHSINKLKNPTVTIPTTAGSSDRETYTGLNITDWKRIKNREFNYPNVKNQKARHFSRDKKSRVNNPPMQANLQKELQPYVNNINPYRNKDLSNNIISQRKVMNKFKKGSKGPIFTGKAYMNNVYKAGNFQNIVKEYGLEYINELSINSSKPVRSKSLMGKYQKDNITIPGACYKNIGKNQTEPSKIPSYLLNESEQKDDVLINITKNMIEEKSDSYRTINNRRASNVSQHKSIFDGRGSHGGDSSVVTEPARFDVTTEDIRAWNDSISNDTAT